MTVSGWDPVALERVGTAPASGAAVESRRPEESEPASHPEELRRLILEQERDAESYRVFGLSVDQFEAGADIVHTARRLTAHDDRHGTLGCYVRLRCRCAKCRAASAAYARDRRRRAQKIACACGTLTRRGRCLSCAMRDVWAVRAA